MKAILIVYLFLIVTIGYTQDYIPEYQADDCPYFIQHLADDTNTDITCGYLYVPEDRNDIDNSYELELFVVEIDAIRDSNTLPFVYLEGGPGGAASVSVEFWLESSFHQDYDIILIDQRGTGLSYPSLNCYEYDEVDDDSWIEDCRDRLVEDEEIALNAYNSANNAHDIHDLLVALDIDEAHIYGSSYGTRLALTMMRDFPNRIASVIIDAVYPPHVDAFVSEATYGNQAIEQIFIDCAASSTCNTTYPNLRQSFYQAVETMNAEPPEIYNYEFDFYVETTGDDFVNQIYLLLYDTESLPYLPALIDAYADEEYDYDPQFEAESIVSEDSTEPLEADEYDITAMEYLDIQHIDALYDYYDELSDDEFFDLMDELDVYADYMLFRDYLGYDSIDDTADYVDSLNDDDYYELEALVTGNYDDNSEGMYLSVECSEETHFNQADDILAQSEGLPEQVGIVLRDGSIDAIAECAIWNVEASDDIENQPVISDIPTLILSGTYDPVTPHQWGTEAQSYLSNSWHYIFPNVGHSALDTQECAISVVLSFLDQPYQQPDDSCMSGVDAPQFYIRP